MICKKMAICQPVCERKLEGQKQKIQLGNHVHRTQHTRIMLESRVPNFYPRMHLTYTFLQNPTISDKLL